jgi:hypothetical protein
MIDYQYSYYYRMWHPLYFTFKEESNDAAVKHASGIKQDSLTRLGIVAYNDEVWRGHITDGKFVRETRVTDDIPLPPENNGTTTVSTGDSTGA